jgi:hypothetical protein
MGRNDLTNDLKRSIVLNFWIGGNRKIIDDDIKKN